MSRTAAAGAAQAGAIPSASEEPAPELAGDLRSQLEPHLAKLEDLRLAIIEKIRQRRIPGLVMAAANLLFWPFLVANGETRGALPPSIGEPLIILIGWAIVSFVIVVWVHAPSMSYIKTYKQTLLPRIAAWFGDFTYRIDGGIDLSRMRKSHFLPKHDGYEHEDLFAGTHKDVGVAFCEARLTRVGGKKKKRRKTILGGVFVLLTVNKRFQGQTIVHHVNRMHHWLRARKEDGLQPVKLEDGGFHRQFEVWSDDQVEARYLLTPAFMERLLQLSRVVGNGELEAVFYDSQLLIVLPANSSGGGITIEMFGKRIGAGKSNLFEPPLLGKSVHETGEIARIAREFASILSVVDTLKLHDTTRL